MGPPDPLRGIAERLERGPIHFHREAIIVPGLPCDRCGEIHVPGPNDPSRRDYLAAQELAAMNWHAKQMEAAMLAEREKEMRINWKAVLTWIGFLVAIGACWWLARKAL